MRLSTDNDAIELTDELIWSIKYWQPIVQARQDLLDGGQCIQESKRKAGQEITLSSKADTAWIRRDVVDKLQEWACQPGLRIKLERHGKEYAVTWLRDDGAPALEVEDLYQRSDPPHPDDWMLVTIRLITISSEVQTGP